MNNHRSPTPWRKSSRSNDSHGQCVETRKNSHRFQIRDSKLKDQSPNLTVNAVDFSSLLTHFK